MLQIDVEYTDFLNNPVKETLHFNLSKADVLKLQAISGKDLEETLREVAQSNDPKLIINKFTEIVSLAYGVVSEDGRRFIKSEEQSEEFRQTAAFDEFLGRLLSYEIDPVKFIEGILPQNLGDLAAKAQGKSEELDAAIKRHPSMQGHLPKRSELRATEIRVDNQPPTETKEDGTVTQGPWPSTSHIVEKTAQPQLDTAPPAVTSSTGITVPEGVEISETGFGLEKEYQLSYVAPDGKGFQIPIQPSDLLAIQAGQFDWGRVFSQG